MTNMVKRLERFQSVNWRLHKKVQELEVENKRLKAGSGTEETAPFKTAANKEIIKPRVAGVDPVGPQLRRFAFTGLDGPEPSLTPGAPEASRKSPKASEESLKKKDENDKDASPPRRLKRSRSPSLPDPAVQEKRHHFETGPTISTSQPEDATEKKSGARPSKRHLETADPEPARNKKQCCRDAPPGAPPSPILKRKKVPCKYPELGSSTSSSFSPIPEPRSSYSLAPTSPFTTPSDLEDDLL